MHSSRVVYFNETVRYAQSVGHMGGHRWRTIAFSGVVTASQKRHARLSRQMSLGLRDFTRDKGVGTRSNGGFKIALRSTGTPSHAPQRSLGMRDTSH
jgi:hypothetical protein